MNTLQATLVRGTDGRISVQDSIAQFHNDLNVYLAKEQADMDNVGSAIAGFWDEHPELKSISLDAISSQVFAKLGKPASAFKDVTERIKSYIRTNTDTFFVNKGKDGGVRLLARMTEEERAKAAQTRAKAAKKSA